MTDIEQQKIKLEQKKNRLLKAETILRLKEQKLHIRNSIKMGELITKAELNTLPVDTLYGALLSLSEQLEKDNEIKSIWTKKGSAILEKEQLVRTAVIFKFDEPPSDEIRSIVKSYGLRWNNLRKEWGGYINDLEALKERLKNIPYNLEIIG